MPRQFCVGGNWKMNGNMASIKSLCTMFTNFPFDPEVEIIIACPSIYITYAKPLLPCTVAIAGQNAYKASSGAFTGEISPEMLKDVGAEWVILGHSERRQLFHETDELVAEKCAHALKCGLGVIACVGETLEEREAGRTNEVVAAQMAALAAKIPEWEKVIIAYEPVWAIGTGKSATPLEAQAVHNFLREWVAQNISKDVARDLRLQYGGSVNAGNCVDLAVRPDIDGFLVGGASLKPEFIDIINSRRTGFLNRQNAKRTPQPMMSSTSKDVTRT